MKTIRIADWSEVPGARTREQGPWSAQEFFEDVLLPALRTLQSPKEELILDLGGTQGYAASFLDALAKTYATCGVESSLTVICAESEPADPVGRGYISSFLHSIDWYRNCELERTRAAKSEDTVLLCRLAFERDQEIIECAKEWYKQYKTARMDTAESMKSRIFLAKAIKEAYPNILEEK